MDYCKDCIRKNKKSPPSECPGCGAETLYAELDGACMCLTCISCGFEIIGASFFPQCHLDDEQDDHTYTVSISAAEKSQYLKVARAFELNTVQLKKYLDSGKDVIRQDLPLDEAIDIMQRLRSVGVSYQVTPDPLDRYPEIMDCAFR